VSTHINTMLHTSLKNSSQSVNINTMLHTSLKNSSQSVNINTMLHTVLVINNIDNIHYE